MITSLNRSNVEIWYVCIQAARRSMIHDGNMCAQTLCYTGKMYVGTYVRIIWNGKRRYAPLLTTVSRISLYHILIICQPTYTHPATNPALQSTKLTFVHLHAHERILFHQITPRSVSIPLIWNIWIIWNMIYDGIYVKNKFHSSSNLIPRLSPCTRIHLKATSSYIS